MTLNDEENLTQEWMGHVRPDVKIKNLRIIGTHDSGAYTINSRFNLDGNFRTLNLLSRIPLIGAVVKQFIKPLAITQKLSIYDQLKNGARFLDLRLAYDKNSNEFFMAHSFGTIPFYTALKDIRRFLSEHPSEDVIVQIKPDYENRKTLDGNLSKCFDQISNIMQDLLWKSDGQEYFGEKVVSDPAIKGKAVICCNFEGDALVNWRKERGKNNIHSSDDKEGLKGQLNMHWGKQETAKNLFVTTLQDKENAVKQKSSKVLQLDGAVTPMKPRKIIAMIFSGLFTSFTNLFRKKENAKMPSVSIAHDAAEMANLANTNQTFLEDKNSNQGYIFTVDGLGSASSHKMILKAINHCIKNSHAETNETSAVIASPAASSVQPRAPEERSNEFEDNMEDTLMSSLRYNC